MTTRTPERLQTLEYILSDGLSYSWFRVFNYDEEACTATVWTSSNDDEEFDERHEVGPDDVARGLRMFREFVEGKRELYKGQWDYYYDQNPAWVAQPAHKEAYVWQTVLFDRTNGEDGDYDANTADMVMQFAVLGEVRYG